MQIQDGKGNGYLAKVDEYNRVHTMSTIISDIGYVSEHSNNAFSISTDQLTFNSTNEHPFLYLKNTSTRLKLAFSSIIYSYNGGNTSYNRSMIKRVYRNPPAPTENYEELTAQNMNFGSLLSAEMDIYAWDAGASDGMSVDLTDYDSFSTSTVQKGTLTLSDIEGVILQNNSSIIFSFHPEEIGTASISIKLFFNYCHCD